MQVLVLRLQTVDSVEERICAVAEGKKALADLSITGGFFDGRRDSATADQRRQYLLDLLAQGAEAAQGEAEAAATSNEQVHV